MKIEPPYHTTTSLVCMLSHFSRVQLHRRQPTRLLHEWDFPGETTGVGCHCLLQYRKEKWKGSCSVVSDSLRAHGLRPTRLLRPWDFPGRSTGVWVPCLLQLMCIHFHKTVIQEDTCTSVLTAALLTTVKTWKQPKYPSTEEWVKKMWDTHTHTHTHTQ